MTKKQKNVSRFLIPGYGNVGGGDYKLWDRSGDLWERSVELDGLDRAETEHLYFDPSVEVAVADGSGGLRWIDPRPATRVGPRA